MALLFATAVVVLLVSCHIILVGVEVKGHAQIQATVLEKVPALFMPLRDPRLDEQLENLSISLNLWGARAFIHSQICILATLLFYACIAPTLCSLSRVLLFGLLYAHSLEMILKGSRLSAWRTAMVPLVIIFLADSWSKSLGHGYGLFETFVANGQRCLCSTALIALVEQLARAMVVSELDAREALEAFRSIVRCSMDADVMLDSQFQMRDRPTRLELLLHRQDEMTGMSFLDLHPDDTATHEFLNLAEKSVEQATSGKKVAPVARLGLKRASGGLVRGDMYMDPPISLTSSREIVDVSLFLDGQTEWFDIKEEAVWSALGTDIAFVPQGLGPLHVRMPEILPEGNGGTLSLLARSSQLRLVQGANMNQDGSDLSVQPVYLCLQLYNFAQLDHRGRPLDLGGVSEFSSMQSEASEY
ncbi:unnamed protein product [Symbiodinium sp. CCMP2592]|nr:unnamed protein product [Symbiodinium sp. CCMP2592]